MAVQRISRSFKDISLSFVPHPVTKDLPIIKNENAIIRSVRNLIETTTKEKFFNSNFGTDVRDLLFENPSLGTEITIKSQITDAINAYEERVDNLLVEVDFSPDLHGIEVSIHFDIKGKEFPTQSINFILEATR
jgi:hypothetical protein